MLECLILGDSIAVGTQQARPECAVIARSSINSRDWVNRNVTSSPYRARTVIISLGSNDYAGIKTEEELRTIRVMTQADRVYWILPAIKPTIQVIVRKIAQEYGDTVLPIPELSADGVHPTARGYRLLAENSR